MARSLRLLAAVSLAALAAGCGDHARLNLAQGVGPAPDLPREVHTPIPTVHVARAIGWPQGAQPVAAPGLQVAPFATGLEHPRWLYTLPNGDVLVAETNAPPPDPAHRDRSIKGFFFRLFQKRAGSGVPSPNRITLLRDADGDGVAEVRTPYLTGLTSPRRSSPRGCSLPSTPTGPTQGSVRWLPDPMATPRTTSARRGAAT